MNKQNVTLKRAMVEALEKSLGIVTTACKSVGINRKTTLRRANFINRLWMAIPLPLYST
jgi:transcriptional regulator of acetoin/glycerol metabolism